MPGSKGAGALKEGALLAVLTAFLALVGLYLPPLQSITNLALAIPGIVLIIRHHLIVGFLSTVMAMLLIALLSSPLQGLLLWVQFASLGLLYGQLFKAKAGMGRILFRGTLVSALGLLVGPLLALALTGASGLGHWFTHFQGSLDSAMRMYSQMGLTEELSRQGLSEEDIRHFLEGGINLLKLLMPALFALSALSTAAFNLFLARVVLRRLNLPHPDLKPFQEWRLPWYVIWGVITGLALWQGGDYLGLKVVAAVGGNILVFYAPLLIVVGMAVVSYYLHRWRVLPAYAMLLAVLAFLNLSPALLFLAALGAFDTLFNYRRLPAVGGGGEGEGQG